MELASTFVLIWHSLHGVAKQHFLREQDCAGNINLRMYVLRTFVNWGMLEGDELLRRSHAWDGTASRIRSALLLRVFVFLYFFFLFSPSSPHTGFCPEDHSLMLATDKYGLLGNRYSIRP